MLWGARAGGRFTSNAKTSSFLVFFECKGSNPGGSWKEMGPQGRGKEAARAQQDGHKGTTRSRKRTTMQKHIRKKNTSTTSIEQVAASGHEHWQSPPHKCGPSTHGAHRNDNCILVRSSVDAESRPVKISSRRSVEFGTQHLSQCNALLLHTTYAKKHVVANDGVFHMFKASSFNITPTLEPTSLPKKL